MELIFYLLLAVFALLGVVEAIRLLSLRIWQFPGMDRKIVCYPVSGGAEMLEMLARSLHEQEKWDCQPAQAVVLVDCGLNEEGRHAAHILCRELPELTFCSKEETAETILSLLSQP